MKIIAKINKSLIISLILVFVPVSIFFGKSEFVKLSESKTEKSKIEFVMKIATSYFHTLNNGNSYNFKNNATKEFKNKMTPDFQKQTYEQITFTIGDFESLKYSGTWKEKGNDKFQIIRLKGRFEKSKVPLEIRIVINHTNKISGLWVKPWKENLNEN